MSEKVAVVGAVEMMMAEMLRRAKEREEMEAMITAPAMLRSMSSSAAAAALAAAGEREGGSGGGSGDDDG